MKNVLAIALLTIISFSASAKIVLKDLSQADIVFSNNLANKHQLPLTIQGPCSHTDFTITAEQSRGFSPTIWTLTSENISIHLKDDADIQGSIKMIANLGVPTKTIDMIQLITSVTVSAKSCNGPNIWTATFDDLK